MVSKTELVSHFADLSKLFVLAVVYVAWLTVGTGVKKLRHGLVRVRTAVSRLVATARSDRQSI
jgi:hypothetical protein